MLRQRHLRTWLEAMGVDMNDVADLRFVPEGVSGGAERPVRIQVTTYCRDEKGQRYVVAIPVRNSRDQVVATERVAATEVRMLDCPALPLPATAALLEIRRALGHGSASLIAVNARLAVERLIEDEPGYDPADLARRFHEAYERLAPDYGYETRRESAVPWDEVPERNRQLMTAVATELQPFFAVPVRQVGALLGDQDYRVLLNYFMTSNMAARPGAVIECLTRLLNDEARRRGFESWVEAYRDAFGEPEDEERIATEDDHQ